MCDRDLMKLEVEAGPYEVQTNERIIAVMLICGWNVRAWTLLESTRGRRRIHVLCKNNTVISVMKALDVVHQRGRIDLANLTLTSQHMLPWFDRLNSSISGYDPDLLPLGVPEATLLLFNRHPSRHGDVVVIWTLHTYSSIRKIFGSMYGRHYKSFQLGIYSRMPLGCNISLAFAGLRANLAVPTLFGLSHRQLYRNIEHFLLWGTFLMERVLDAVVSIAVGHSQQFGKPSSS